MEHTIEELNQLTGEYNTQFITSRAVMGRTPLTHKQGLHLMQQVIELFYYAPQQIGGNNTMRIKDSQVFKFPGNWEEI